MNKLNIEPLFNFDSDQNSFSLYKEIASISVEDELYTGKGEAKLELLPHASIVFDAEFENVSAVHIMGDMFGNSSSNTFSLNNHVINGFNIGGSSELSTWRIKWRASSEPIKFQLLKNEKTKNYYYIYDLIDYSNKCIWPVYPRKCNRFSSQHHFS